MRGHLGSACDLAVVARGDSNGRTDYCYYVEHPVSVASGDYSFRSKNGEPSTNPPTGGSLVNSLILPNGTTYSLAGLNETAIGEAVCPHIAAATPLLTDPGGRGIQRNCSCGCQEV